MLNNVSPANVSSAPKPVTHRYDSYDKYTIVECIIDAYPANHVLTATEKSTGKSCFLSLRHGEYSAQLDKAVSDIYRKYVSSTPETWIVRKGDDFYVASNTIINLTEYVDIPEQAVNFKPLHLGANSVLSHYLGETDIHEGNMLLSTEDEFTFVGHKIDNADSLDDVALQSARLVSKNEDSDEDSAFEEEPEFSVDELFLEAYVPKPEQESFDASDVFYNYWGFPKAVVNHFHYQQEQQATLKAIAATPFAEIAGILRSTVTASKRAENLLFLEKLYKSNLIDSKSVRKKIKTVINNPEQYPILSEIEDLIQLLEKRHQRYATLKC